MKLLNDQLPEPTLGTQPCPLEEEPVLDMKKTMGMLGAFLKKLLEIFIMGIQALHHLKSKDFGAQNSKRCLLERASAPLLSLPALW